MTGKLTGEKLEKEMLRLEEMLTYERQYGWAGEEVLWLARWLQGQ